MTEADLLRRAAQRAAHNPFFLASVLKRVAEADRLDEHALAARLGCETSALAPLMLCRRPSARPAAFRQEVARIAERFGADALRLAEVIRMGESMEALARGAGADQDLLAARDRDTEEPPE